MAANHKHRFPDFLTSHRVPVSPVEIDWSHPLAVGLVSCYLPGVTPVDLTGVGLNLTYGSASARSSGPNGPGLVSNASGAGASATAVPQQKLTQAGTLFWRGWSPSDSSSSGPLIGVVYDNAGGSPFISYALENQNDDVIFSYNPGGVFANIDINAILISPAICSVAATFNFSGNANLYYNGKTVGSGALTGAPVFTSTSPISINTFPGSGNVPNKTADIALIYNRALTAADVAWLDNEPYAMLRPVARRVFGSGVTAPIARVPYQPQYQLAPTLAQ